MGLFKIGCVSIWIVLLLFFLLYLSSRIGLERLNFLLFNLLDFDGLDFNLLFYLALLFHLDFTLNLLHSQFKSFLLRLGLFFGFKPIRLHSLFLFLYLLSLLAYLRFFLWFSSALEFFLLFVKLYFFYFFYLWSRLLWLLDSLALLSLFHRLILFLFFICLLFFYSDWCLWLGTTLNLFITILI